ncbi:MAG: hypothetical protein IJ169_04455 [Paludibacteraceae bacterium]|nr:hypothetical protein [Paludibacteraceae bacterium]
MLLTLNRQPSTDTCTMGTLSVNGTFFCHTLEPPVRPLGKYGEGKVPGQTAIPAGTYTVRVTYSPHFQRNLPLLMHVPFFFGIRIHCGNTVKDSAGCILVGEQGKREESLSNSRTTEFCLTQRLLRAQLMKENIIIQINGYDAV